MLYDAYVDINLDNIKHNTQTLCQYYPDYQYYIGVVKGFGYSHGSYIVKTLIENGINYLAVSSLQEVYAVRKWTSDTPLLCLEPINLAMIDECVKQNVTMTVASLAYGLELVKLNPKVKVHIKIDSGMNRLGFNNVQQLKTFINACQDTNIELEGIYTHMAYAGFIDNQYDKQMVKFELMLEAIDHSQFKIIHADRSLTFMSHVKSKYCNAIRPGIFLYGYNQLPKPTSGLKQQLRKIKYSLKNTNYSATLKSVPYQLKPAFALYSRVIDLKHVDQGDKVGYGGMYMVEKPETIAIVSIGYADGLMLSYQNKHVAINKQLFDVVGSVNMKMISVKVDDSVKIGDVVEIFGDTIKAQQIASVLNITVYKLLCDISLGLPRIYYQNQQIVYTEEGKSM